MEMSYQPVPASMQQQSSNVVVVNQPTEPQTIQVRHVGRASDYLCCSICLCLLCMLSGNWLAMLCSFPAVIFSCVASIHNDAGEHELAGRFGSLACKFNIGTILPSIILAVAVIVVVILLAVGVFAVGGTAVSIVSDTADNINNNYGT